MPDIEKHGCAHCFAAIYHPTAEERQRGICDTCHARAMERADNADVLNND